MRDHARDTWIREIFNDFDDRSYASCELLTPPTALKMLSELYNEGRSRWWAMENVASRRCWTFRRVTIPFLSGNTTQRFLLLACLRDSRESMTDSYVHTCRQTSEVRSSQSAFEQVVSSCSWRLNTICSGRQVSVCNGYVCSVRVSSIVKLILLLSTLRVDF